MNCDNFENSISLYIDDELSDIEKREFELHLVKCEKCRREYESMINILKIVKENEQEELPDGYNTELKQKLIESSSDKRIVNWKLMASIAASLLVLFTSYELIFNNNMLDQDKTEYGLKQEQSIETQEASDIADEAIVMAKEKSTNEVDNRMVQMDQAQEKTAANDSNSAGSGTSKAVEFNNENSDISNNNYTSANNYISDNTDIGNSNIAGIQAARGIITNRKVVEESSLDIDVDEVDSTLQKIIIYVKENNGFVESLKIEDNQENANGQPITKEADIKIRIPQDKFDQTVTYIKELGTLINVQSSISDITEKYMNIENDLAYLRDREIKLGEILNKSQDIDDINLIKDELSKIKEKIESNTNTLNEMDNSATLSTINITLIEHTDE